VQGFLSTDPLAADFASWSPYNYVLGNPISLVDPDGRSAEEANCCGQGFITSYLADKANEAGFPRVAGALDALAGTDPVFTNFQSTKALINAESGGDVVRALDPTGLSSLPNAISAAANGDERVQAQLATGAVLAVATRRIGGNRSTSNRNVSLDNNALIAAVEGGKATVVKNAINGRNPTVSRQAAKEFLVRGDKQQLKNFMGEVGATVSRNGGSTAQVQALQSQATSMGRRLRGPDAKVAADAINNNASLITRDRSLRNFMNAAGHSAESF